MGKGKFIGIAAGLFLAGLAGSLAGDSIRNLCFAGKEEQLKVKYDKDEEKLSISVKPKYKDILSAISFGIFFPKRYKVTFYISLFYGLLNKQNIEQRLKQFFSKLESKAQQAAAQTESIEASPEAVEKVEAVEPVEPVEEATEEIEIIEGEPEEEQIY